MPTFAFLVLSTLVAQLAAQPCVLPVVTDVAVGVWSKNIAEVRGDSGESGLGLVVGWLAGQAGSAGQAWIVVPAHVLYNGLDNANATPTLKSGLQVRFGASDSFRKLCPSRASLSNPTLSSVTADVAFVCVEWNGSPWFWSTFVARSVSKDVNVELRTLERGFRRAGLVSDVEQKGPDDFLKVTFVGDLGMSGGPVVSPSGVVGLYLGRTVPGSRVVSIHTVRRLALGAEVPWGLAEQEFFDCRRKAQVCLSGDTTLLPSSLTLTESRMAKGIAIARNGCNDVTEGKYILIDSTKEFVCEPMTVSVRSEDGRAINVLVECDPDLFGTWMSPEGHRLDCGVMGPSPMRQAQCSGLQSMGLGTLKVTLARIGQRFNIVQGAFEDINGNSRVVTGEFAWRSRSLSGRLVVAGFGPLQVELQKRDQ